MLHRIRVPTAWLDEGDLIEFELPRNLKCAQCEGGGCDRCERSGAISVRGRKELGEVLQVTLPKRNQTDLESTASGRSIVIRIPERGGLSDNPALPRGLLLLSVVPSEAADPGVTRIERAAPVAPRAPDLVESVPPPATATTGPNRTVLVVAVLVILWVLLLIWLRVTGRG